MYVVLVASDMRFLTCDCRREHCVISSCWRHHGHSGRTCAVPWVGGRLGRCTLCPCGAPIFFYSVPSVT